MFVRGFCILEWLAVNASGMTVGQLQRACKEFSASQIRRTLQQLVDDRFVYADRQGGHGFGKVVYTLNRNVAINCELLAEKFFAQEVAQ